MSPAPVWALFKGRMGGTPSGPSFMRKPIPSRYGILDNQGQAFAMHVAGGMSITDAFQAAFSERVMAEKLTRRQCSIRGARVADRKAVKAEIERLKQETEATYAKALASSIVDRREWVMSSLVEVAERCMEKREVIVKGKPSGRFVFDSKGANQALHLIGKEIGMFVDRKEIRRGPLTEQSDDQLDAEMRRLLDDMAKLTGKTPAELLAGAMRNEVAIDITPSDTQPVLLADAMAIADVLPLRLARDDDPPTTRGGTSNEGGHGTQ